jgi:hypothetical protein
MIQCAASEEQMAVEAAQARVKAYAWACSVPGTPYGGTEPVLGGETTAYQKGQIDAHIQVLNTAFANTPKGAEVRA